MASPPSSSGSHSQTLDRGIRILEILANARMPLTIAELADRLGVHRSIAYRILRTHLVARDAAGRVHIGIGIAELAQAVEPDLQTAALPELTRLSGELTMTAFLSVLERADCVVLLSVEPRHQPATIVYRPGSRHPVQFGAPGIALQSLIDDRRWAQLVPDTPKRREIEQLRRRGYAVTRGEVIRGMTAVSVPLRLPGGGAAALSVVYVETELDEARVGELVRDGAAGIERNLTTG
jgi:DNA-binding IclR family transcriptional regulator